jgi:hypothetical protein
MKIVIEIPEKTNAHIRSDYGHGVKGLEYEDMLMLCDAVYHGEPYHNRPHGEWIDSINDNICSVCKQNSLTRWKSPFCPNCGADMRKEVDTNDSDPDNR